MPPSEPLLPCPFCQARGKMSRMEIISRLEDPDLPEKIIVELNRANEGKEAVPVGAPEGNEPGASDFASKVHGWNKNVLWRRSSKE